MNALSYITTKVISFFKKIDLYYFTPKRNNFLILNLNVEDRKFFSDILYQTIGITRTYRKTDGITTKYSEMVLTKDTRFIFYKNQSFLENSLENSLEFANESRIKLNEVDGLIYMVNLRDAKSIKYSEFELDFILKCFSSKNIGLNVIVFNAKGNEFLIEELMGICDLEKLNKIFDKNISCYICELNEKNVENFFDVCNNTLERSEKIEISNDSNLTK